MEAGKIYFFTASILNWNRVLAYDSCKQIVLDSLKFLTEKNAIELLGFVIMPNHIHLIWKILPNSSIHNVQQSFMKFTAQKIKFWLKDHNPHLLRNFLVRKSDRGYQIWQRNPLAVELYPPKVLEQKLDYIHNNPCQGKWMLASDPTAYDYSSANFYETGYDSFGLLTHYKEVI